MADITPPVVTGTLSHETLPVGKKPQTVAINGTITDDSALDRASAVYRVTDSLGLFNRYFRVTWKLGNDYEMTTDLDCSQSRTYTIRVECKDVAGNLGFHDWTVTVASRH
jgi:hypothetical protein